jgi:hypothetical protein
VLFQSGTGSSARVGINSTTPASTLDVNGSETIRGNLSLPPKGPATATGGKSSQPTTLTASVFNKTTGTAVAQNFRWQAEPVGNNTAAATGSLNLLYAAGTNALAETGLTVGNNGQITFAKGQTFPASTVTGNETVQGNVSASGQLISTVSTGTAPLQVTSTTRVPNLNASLLGGMPASTFATLGSNAFAGNQSITGSVGIGTNAPAQALDLNNGSMVVRVDPGNDTTGADGGYSLVGRGAGGVPNTWWTFTAPVGGGFGVPVNSYSIWQYPPNQVPSCCLNRFNILPAEQFSDTGGAVTIDQNGNASQARSAGGMVKALVAFDGFSTITSCYNSSLTGAAATTPPCGFTETTLGTGAYNIDFGFQVSDRFISVTPVSSGICNGFVCPGPTWWVQVGSFQPASQANIIFVDISYAALNTAFHLAVF